MSFDDDLPQPDDWEVGYHYTSWTNWLKIQREGLVPTLLSQDKINSVTPYVEGWNGCGVWVWVDRLSPVEHMGSLIYQLGKRQETALVTLRVSYQFRDRLPPRPNDQGNVRLQLRHAGKIDEYRYHVGTKSCLVMKTIPPQHIQLMRVYDLIKLLA